MALADNQIRVIAPHAGRTLDRRGLRTLRLEPEPAHGILRGKRPAKDIVCSSSDREGVLWVGAGRTLRRVGKLR